MTHSRPHMIQKYERKCIISSIGFAMNIPIKCFRCKRFQFWKTICTAIYFTYMFFSVYFWFFNHPFMGIPTLAIDFTHISIWHIDRAIRVRCKCFLQSIHSVMQIIMQFYRSFKRPQIFRLPWISDIMFVCQSSVFELKQATFCIFCYPSEFIESIFIPTRTHFSCIRIFSSSSSCSVVKFSTFSISDRYYV